MLPRASFRFSDDGDDGNGGGMHGIAFYSPLSAVAATFTGTFALTSIGRFAILSEEVTTHVSPADRFAGSKYAAEAIITHIAVAQTALPQVPDMNGPQRDIEIKLG
jgi:hypothetical protein